MGTQVFYLVVFPDSIIKIDSVVTVNMETTLSCYILTYNSERYLADILSQIRSVVDDLIIVDSGSHDNTQTIAEQYGCRFLIREFDHFKAQREFALASCQSNWVLSLDSDEIPEQGLIETLRQLKANQFRLAGKRYEAFRIQRRWFVLGKEVRAFYPMACPDYPIRLLDKTQVGYGEHSRRVHETPHGYTHIAVLPGWVNHYSCHSYGELQTKLKRYTKLAAEDLRQSGRRPRLAKLLLSPFGAWWKWYVFKQGWKDGRVGFLLGMYAYRYTYLKWKLFRKLTSVG